ncbi:glycosyltransferase family 2 protein, partial [Candidatus Saccharibacteria bacterium]|nr:glycosyltransferase family 2 protein [Candidatus Saccharibacteria bacterium]
KTLTVSIIIPVYNEEDYIKQCLDHIAAQKIPPQEVIVVDNNSTDNTLKIVKDYKFVRVLTEKQQGVLYARNKGFNQAKSQIIGRIDADTRLEPDWVEQLQKIFSGSNIDAVTGSSHFYDMPLSPWNHKVEDVFKHNLYTYEKDFPFLFGTNMAIRKSAWNQVKDLLCEDKYIFEDSDLAIHLYQTGHKILYDKNLRAGMSARRYQDSPADFKKYINLQSLTYKKHDIHTVGSKVAIAAYFAGYLLARPLSKSYDNKSQKRSLRHLLFGDKQAREHPFES